MRQRPGLSIRARAGSAVALALLVTLLGACGDKASEAEYEGPAVEVAGSRNALTERVVGILAKSQAATEEYILTRKPAIGNGSEVTVTARRVPGADADLSPGRRPGPELRGRVPDFAPGELLVSSEILPASIALMADGSLVYTQGNTLHVHRHGATRTLDGVPAQRVVADPSRTRLIAEDQGALTLLYGDGLRERRTLAAHPPGRAYWWSGDQLVFVHETIALDASQSKRVDLALELMSVPSGAIGEAPWQPMGRYAALGTTGPTPLVWGHVAKSYQIDPMPAPLLRLQDGRPDGNLTETTDAADVEPALVGEELFWIRTWRRASRTGRLYATTLGPGELAAPLTTRPTWAVAANGTSVVYTSENPDGLHEIRRIEAGGWPDIASIGRDATAADELMREKARRIQRGLTIALLKSEFAPLVSREDFGWSLKAPPPPELAQRLAAEFRALAGRELDVSIPAGAPGAAPVDSLLVELAPYFTEDPSVVIAFGGVLADALGSRASWMLEGAGNSLSSDVRETWTSDGLVYTAVQPYGAAREALAGRLSLGALVRRLYSAQLPPIMLVENFRSDTIERVRRRAWQETGLPAEGFTLADLDAYLKRTPNAGAYPLQVAIRAARSQGNQALGLDAALRLADIRPVSSEALGTLARVLYDTAYTREAADVYAQAVALAPEDLGLRMDYAGVLMILGDMKEAREQLGLVGRLDQTGAHADEISMKQELLKTLEREGK